MPRGFNTSLFKPDPATRRALKLGAQKVSKAKAPKPVWTKPGKRQVFERHCFRCGKPFQTQWNYTNCRECYENICRNGLDHA